MKIGDKSIERATQLVKDLMWANKENIDRANLMLDADEPLTSQGSAV
jgi:hypothetical protein